MVHQYFLSHGLPSQCKSDPIVRLKVLYDLSVNFKYETFTSFVLFFGSFIFKITHQAAPNWLFFSHG